MAKRGPSIITYLAIMSCMNQWETQVFLGFDKLPSARHTVLFLSEYHFLCGITEDIHTRQTYLFTHATCRKQSVASLQSDIFHTLDLFVSLPSNTRAVNDCTTETQSYPARFCKDRLGPVTVVF